MALPSFFSGTWQRFGRLSDRTPLRVKVLTAMLALVGLGLVIISVAGVLVFRDYLTNRADTALRQQYQLAVASTQSGRLQPNTIAHRRFLRHRLAPAGQATAAPGRPLRRQRR